MKLINFYLLFLFFCYTRSYTVTDRIDFERECDKQMQVFDYSIIEVFAFPGIGNSEISQCKAKFVASPADRKLRIYIQEFKLEGLTCGHQMNIYDNTEFLNKPTWTLGCNSPLTTYTTSSNNAILSFTKPTVDSSQGYRFKILITTDREESTLSFKPFKLTSNRLFEALKLPDYRNLHHRNRRDDTPSYTAPLTGDASGTGSGGISSGAIAGIAIGCVVGAVIIIAICIYALWKYMRKTEEKKRYGANEPPPVFVTSTSSTVNGILKHPGSGGSTRSKSTKSRGIDNDAFSDLSESKGSRYNENPDGYRREEENERGSYSRRSRGRSRYDEGHQNPSYMDDDYDRRDRYGDRRQSYKHANEEKPHISLADLANRDGVSTDRSLPLRPRKYGDESSRTESSFQTDTSNRTYSDSQDSRDDFVNFNPSGNRYRRNEREGSIRRSRSRSKSMTSSQSGQTRRSQQRSSSADRVDKASQQGSHQGSQSPRQHHHHHHHRGSSRDSRRKKQKPPDPYLPIFAETKKSKKKH